MKKLLMSAFALAAAACSGGSGNGQNGQGAAAVSLQPGLWEMVDVFTEADVENVPEAAAAQVRAQLNRPDTNRNCITPQMAANPAQNLRDALAGSRAAGQQCTFSEDTYANGVVRIRATCGSVQLTMDGSFTPTTADVRVTSTAQGPPAPDGSPVVVRLRGTSTSRRIGDCPR